jgi:acyl-CoA dehydrogenase
MGKVEEGFKLLMQDVLHVSRLFNGFGCLGLARRAYQIAYYYANHRQAFKHYLMEFPLIKELLAQLKVEQLAGFAFMMQTIRLQDKVDLNKSNDKEQLLVRVLANLGKTYTAKLAVNHVHHAIDVLGGNGAIESFSSLPRLLRDSIVYENWEGTHNTLQMQFLRDMEKYQADAVLMNFLDNKLSKIESKEKSDLEKGLLNFKTLLKKFHQETALQTLKIKPLVEKICHLIAAVALLEEAYFQKKAFNNEDKMWAFKLYCHRHLANQETDEQYFNLIKKL